MGYNSVVFLLNDHMSEIERAPKAFTYLCTHPPMGANDQTATIRRYAFQIAQENNESTGSLHQITVMPTFHSSHYMFYIAGRNNIESLEVLKYGKTKDGVKTITLILPDYLQKETT